jgi:integrase
LPPRPNPGDVTLWVERIQAERSPATANKLLRAMKSVTERATLFTRNGGMAVRNAFRAVRPRRLPVRERRDPPRTTIERLLGLAANPFERLAVRLAAFYGLRRGEILALRTTDVRTRNGRVLVHVERTRDAYGERQRKNAQNGRLHIITIDDGETAGILTALCDETNRLGLALTSQRDLALTYIIPWGHDHPQALMRRWRKDPGVALPQGDAWHALRHYGATALAEQGKSPVEIQAWLGDSTATATQTYMGQVRGTTYGGAAAVIRAFEAGKESHESKAGGSTCDASQTTPRGPPLGLNPNPEDVTNPNLVKGKTRE